MEINRWELQQIAGSFWRKSTRKRRTLTTVCEARLREHNGRQKKNSDNYGATASGKQQGKGPRATQNYPHLKYKVYRPPHFSAGVHQALYTHAPNRGCFVAIKKKIEWETQEKYTYSKMQEMSGTTTFGLTQFITAHKWVEMENCTGVALQNRNTRMYSYNDDSGGVH